MKKIFSVFSVFLFSLITIISFFGCGVNETIIKEIYYENSDEKKFDVKVVTLETKEVPVRTVSKSKVVSNSIENGKKEKVTLGFMEGKEQIPYIFLSSELLNDHYSENPNEHKVYEISEVTPTSSTVTVESKVFNTKAVFDLTKHTLTFENYDAFFQLSMSPENQEKVYIDISSMRTDYLQITDSLNIPGNGIIVDWSDLDIDVVISEKDGEHFLAMPLQMFCDIFLAKKQYSLVYNGKYIYASSVLVNSNELLNDYYENGIKTARSQALANFCYNELCLNLDLNYGLKSIHGINTLFDFDSYLTDIGLKKQLTNTDSIVFSKALKELCEVYFGDGHSDYLKNSYFLGKDIKISSEKTSQMRKKYDEHIASYMNSRLLFFKGAMDSTNFKGIPAFEKSADNKTAIVRFDSFTFNDKPKSKVTKIPTAELDTYVSNLENKYDTVELIHTVNDLIQNDDDIENIVIDLSCNGGGTTVSAAFILSWLLGEGTQYTTNTITGAKCITTYIADVNLDGVFDSNKENVLLKEDTINDKNLFCLISPLSFSCGNLVPAMLKSSRKVTIIGDTSAGGTCFVQPSSAADGTIFRMSSKYQISDEQNGSLYDVDRGVEPHYRINQPAKFYDIEEISALVNSINANKIH